MTRRLLLLSLLTALVLNVPVSAGGPGDRNARVTPAVTIAPTWQFSTVDADGDSGRVNALALTAANQPRIAYYKSSPDSGLRYAYPVTPTTGNCGSNNSFSCEWADFSPGAGQFMGMVLGTDGAPRISYRKNAQLWYAQRIGGSGGTCFAGSAWNCYAVDARTSDGGVGRYNSVAVDPVTGNPRASYFLTHTLGYAAFGVTSGNCGPGSSWRCDQIDAGVAVTDVTGWTTSIAVGANSLAHIAYYHCGLATAGVCPSADLRVAQQLAGPTGNCGPGNYWKCDDIDTLDDTGWFPSVALDSQGKMQITYFYCGDVFQGCAGDLKYARQVTSGGNCGPGNTWLCETVDTGGAGVEVGEYSSLTIRQDVPYVTYYDRTNGAVKVAYRVGTGGNCGPGDTTWRCATLAAVGTAEVVSSVRVDASGQLHVSYYDASSGDLMYALSRWFNFMPATFFNAAQP